MYLKDDLKLSGSSSFRGDKNSSGESVVFIKKESGFHIQVLSVWHQQANVTYSDIENYSLPLDYFKVHSKADFAQWLQQNRIRIDLDTIWESEQFRQIIL